MYNYSMNKRQHGQYFTIYNPFKNKPFNSWWQEAMEKSRNKKVLEPFAGANNLIKTLKQDRIFEFESYDIDPKDKNVKKRNTLKSFPTGFDIIVTNPPYLAKNSARRNNLDADFKYDDLYKDCLEKMLDNCGYIAAIIPATFLHWGKLNDRLYAYVMLTEKMFEDTETPVCLALFKPKPQKRTLFYLNSKKLIIKDDSLNYEKKMKIKFNSPKDANIGLIAFDNTRMNSIKFVDIKMIDLEKIKNTSRNIVSITVENTKITKKVISNLNKKLNQYREITHDVYLTPFKGVKKDLTFRRRIMFKQARAIIEEELNAN